MKDYLQPVPGNLPEVVWDQLKAVAADQASSGEKLLIEECITHVDRVVRAIAGRPDVLPLPVITFYAEELQARIALLIDGAER